MAVTTPPGQTRRAFPQFWRVSDWGLRPKLAAAFLITSLVPLLLMSLFGMLSGRATAMERITAALGAAAQDTAEDTDTGLQDHLDYTVVVSQMPSIAGYAANPGDSALRASALRELSAAATRRSYDAISVVNSDGLITLSSYVADANTNIRVQVPFSEAMKGNAYIANPGLSTVTGRPSIEMSAPIRDTAGKIVGVLRSRIDLEEILAQVDQDRNLLGPGSFGMLLDEHGIRMAVSSTPEDRDQVVKTLLYRAVAPLPEETIMQLYAEKRFSAATEGQLQVLPLPEVAANMKRTVPEAFESAADNSSARHMAYMVRLQVKPWYYVVMAPMSTVNASVEGQARAVMLVSILTGLVAIGLSVLIARGLSRPILQLVKTVDRISLGELDAKIEINRKDEIGQLAQALRRLQASLKAAMERAHQRRKA